MVGERPADHRGGQVEGRRHVGAEGRGRAIVTGQHEYASDIRRPGMLFGKVLRPAVVQGEAGVGGH